MTRTRSLPALIVSLCLAAPSARAETPEEAVRIVERQIADAIIAKDTAVLERVVADDYVSYGYSTTHVLGKRDVMLGVKSPRYVAIAIEYPPSTVRIFSDVAIVQGTTKETSTFDGKDISSTTTWMDVYALRAGNWVLIANECAKVD